MTYVVRKVICNNKVMKTKFYINSIISVDKLGFMIGFGKHIDIVLHSNFHKKFHILKTHIILSVQLISVDLKYCLVSLLYLIERMKSK